MRLFEVSILVFVMTKDAKYMLLNYIIIFVNNNKQCTFPSS